MKTSENDTSGVTSGMTDEELNEYLEKRENCDFIQPALTATNGPDEDEWEDLLLEVYNFLQSLDPSPDRDILLAQLSQGLQFYTTQ